MDRALVSGLGLLVALVLPQPAGAQAASTAIAIAAEADAFSTEPGGFLLAIPGVADDFVLFADGAFDQRADGTARLSAYAQRSGAIDREFVLVLELSGRVAPGDAAYPPAGAPVLTLLPGAYAPAGPVDPNTFVYWTQVTGTLTGLRTFAGARLTATQTAPAQLGLGASNRNVRNGLAVDLALAVVQQPTAGPLVITGPASLRAEVVADHACCLAHVDAQTAASGSNARLAVNLPGVASDYVFSPAGTWLDAGSGSATLTAQLRRQGDYGDRWQLQLTLTGRTIPGDAAHPPAGSPVLQLLPTAYAPQGPVDPAQWRYYTAASGTLTGAGSNGGGLVQLSAAAPVQVGLGAGQGNLFFGASGAFTANVAQQPTSHTIAITGNLTLNANLSSDCLLPVPQLVTGLLQAIPNVSQQRLVYTGVDLGFCELVAVGAHVLGTNERRWFEGHLRVLTHDTIEVALPQALPPGNYQLRALNRTAASNPAAVDVQMPPLPVMRTEDQRLPGEAQHWVAHQGNVAGFAFCFVVLSLSNVPSFAPGFVNLLIGNQFSDYVLLDVAVHDPITGAAIVTAPVVPASFVGLRIYAQGALMDSAIFPLHPTDAWFTDY